MKDKTVGILAIVLSLILITLGVIFFTPIGKQSTFEDASGSLEYAPIGKSCSSNSDCESSLISMGLTQNDLANVPHRCNENQCEVQGYKP